MNDLNNLFVCKIISQSTVFRVQDVCDRVQTQAVV